MSTEALALGLFLLVGLAVLVGAFAVIRHAPRTRASAALGGGDFSGALASSETGEGANPQDLLAAALAAKHLLRFDQAAQLLNRALEADPTDGEAWLERGLVAAYAGDLTAADEALANAVRLRADLAESVTLHRAWVALTAGRTDHARRLFEEIEAPLESKLLVDLGPGDPLFSEWFLQAADLWRARGREARATWAQEEGLRAAGDSRLGEILGCRPLE